MKYFRMWMDDSPNHLVLVGPDHEVKDEDKYYHQRKHTREYVNSWKPGEDWEAPLHHIVYEEGRKRYSFADFPFFGGKYPIISERAADALRPLMETAGPILPIKLDNQRDSSDAYVIWAVPYREDLIDFDNCEKEYYSDGSFDQIGKFAYFSERLHGVVAFRCIEVLARTIVNEIFVQAWKEAGLTGAEFKEVWETKLS